MTYRISPYAGTLAIGVALALLAGFVLPMLSQAAVISGVTASSTADGTGAVVTWTTDVPATSLVHYGTTTSYGSSSPLLNETSPVVQHSVLLSDLLPNTLYHYAVHSFATSTATTTGTTATSTSDIFSDQTFTTALGTAATTTATTTATTATTTDTGTATSTSPTATTTSPTATTTQQTATTTATSTPSTATTTATSTESMSDLRSVIMGLQNLINQLLTRINSLESMIRSMGGSTSGGSSGVSTTTASMVQGAHVEQDGGTYVAGSMIDFSGRGFPRERNITVLLGGSMVATAHADGGGNFSTGGVRLPTTPGSYTYNFRGQDISLNVSISVR